MLVLPGLEIFRWNFEAPIQPLRLDAEFIRIEASRNPNRSALGTLVLFEKLVTGLGEVDDLNPGNIPFPNILKFLNLIASPVRVFP